MKTGSALRAVLVVGAARLPRLAGCGGAGSEKRSATNGFRSHSDAGLRFPTRMG